MTDETRTVFEALRHVMPKPKLRDVVTNDRLCALLGINPWCVNEGADGDEEVDVIRRLLERY